MRRQLHQSLLSKSLENIQYNKMSLLHCTPLPDSSRIGWLPSWQSKNQLNMWHTLKGERHQQPPSTFQYHKVCMCQTEWPPTCQSRSQ